MEKFKMYFYSQRNFQSILFGEKVTVNKSDTIAVNGTFHVMDKNKIDVKLHVVDETGEYCRIQDESGKTLIKEVVTKRRLLESINDILILVTESK